MIVKNEEKVLKRCLDSIKEVIDEIVIVDTGSTDSTKDIAFDYTDNVYDFEWTDSFADARNFAQTKATGEWILVMDADEYVDPINLNETIQEIKQIGQEYDAYEVKIYNFTGFQGERIIQHTSIRIYKNNPSVYFHRTIHEQLTKKGGDLKVGSSHLILYHSGYLNRVIKEKNKNERNQQLLEKEIKLSGNTGFDYFNLGNEYLSLGKTKDALDAYINAYQKKPDFRYSWVSFCIIQIINCLIQLKRYQDALNVIKDAEEIYVQSPDLKCLKGNIYLLQNRIDDAIVELEDLLNNKEIFQNCISSIDFLEYHPYYFLGLAYKKRKEYEKAVYYFAKAFSNNRYSYQSLYNLIEILSKTCSREEVDIFIKKQELIRNQQDLYILIRLFLSIANLELAIKYIDKITGDPLIKQGFLIKLESIQGNWTRMSDFIKAGSVEELNTLLNSGCVDIYDLIIYAYIYKNKNFALLLAELIKDKKDKNLIEFLFSTSNSNFPNKDSYIKLLERTLKINQFSLFQELAQKVFKHDDFSLSIGHLLFQYDLKKEALDYYEKVDHFSYDDQTFINLIQYYLDQNDNISAWNWILVAISLEKKDFRLFEFALELFIKYPDICSIDVNLFLNTAFEYFPGSKKLIYLNSLIQDQLSEKTERGNIANKDYVVGFFVETTFHYYIYESIINNLVKNGVKCHIVINDNYAYDSETSYMYQDLITFIENLDRNDIEAYTVSMIRKSQFKYDCMVSPYYSVWLQGIASKHVRAMYGLAKEIWNFAWWNVFYDKILCYGDYDYSRLNIYDNCVIVGNPKFDYWFKKQIPNFNKVKETFDLEEGKLTILYAPTYGNMSSIDDWIEEINDLQKYYNVIVKLHHGTALRESEKSRREYIKKNFKNVTSSQHDLFTILKLSQLVITDNSGIIFDAMLAGKNILLLNPASQNSIEESYGQQFLRKHLIQLNKGSDLRKYIDNKELFDKQKTIIEKFKSELNKYTDGNSGKRAAEEILKLLEDEKANDNKFLLSLRHQIFS